MSSANRDILSTSLPVCIPFISSSCLIALAWNSRTILKRSGESRYPWREAILSGQVDFWILKEKKIGVSMKHKYQWPIHYTHRPAKDKRYLWCPHAQLFTDWNWSSATILRYLTDLFLYKIFFINILSEFHI
jgi:hypothetical protein